jgi:flagellar basal-body rod protein FlgB
MFAKPEVMEIAAARAAHAALRQSAIAGNVANADTPGYRAMDVAAFESVWRDTSGDGLRHTRAGHIGGQDTPIKGEVSLRAQPGALSPNGNDVSLESEMVVAASVKKDHDLALAVYRTSLDILRTSLGRR